MAIEVSLSEKKEENPMIPSSSQEDNNRSQGQEFLEHCLQSQVSPCENFGDPLEQGTKGQAKSQKTPDKQKMTKPQQQERRPPRNLVSETRAALSDKRH